MPKIYFSLGSNLGDRLRYLRAALHELQKVFFSAPLVSSFYETEPVGFKNQPYFLNCCVRFETDSPPEKILGDIHAIERKLGRMRRLKFGPRTVDLDILFYDDLVSKSPRLIIPHPEIPHRRFVLVPMVEIEPEFLHPKLKRTLRVLLKECPDTSIVRALPLSLHEHPSAQKTRDSIPN